MSNELSAETRYKWVIDEVATTEGGMLVLSRRRSERIVIGSSILVTVVRVDGNQVRLGIEAPDELSIVRAELLTRGTRQAVGSRSRTRLPGNGQAD